MSDKLAAIKREQNKAKLMAAYDAYERKEPGSADALLAAVRAFAYIKVYHLEYDFKNFGSAETADDWAQDICLNVWKDLDKFEGTGSNFYSWVNKVAFNQATDAFNALKEQQQEKVSLTIPIENDDSEEGDEQDNPEIYRDGAGYGGSLQIPASVQGTDRDICELIMDGRKQAEIAEELHMKVGTIKKRLQRLRERMKDEREQEKTKELPPGIRVPMRTTRPRARIPAILLDAIVADELLSEMEEVTQ